MKQVWAFRRFDVMVDLEAFSPPRPQVMFVNQLVHGHWTRRHFYQDHDCSAKPSRIFGQTTAYERPSKPAILCWAVLSIVNDRLWRSRRRKQVDNSQDGYMAKSKPKLVHVTWDSAFSGALQARHRSLEKTEARTCSELED